MATSAATSAHTGMDAQNYRALMRHQAGAVTVVAGGTAPARAGLTATAVSSLSDSPPTILVCVGRKTGAHTVINSSNSFSINVLSSGQQDIAERFAGKHNASGEARFIAKHWSSLLTGAPVLEGALANLDCELLEQHAFTTHTIFIGRVVSGRMRPELSPLLYFRGDYWDLPGKRG